MVVTFKVRLRRKTEKPELHVECSEGLERAHFTEFLQRGEGLLAVRGSKSCANFVSRPIKYAHLGHCCRAIPGNAVNSEQCALF